METTKDFWDAYKKGRPLLGTHITCNDPQQTEMLSAFPFSYFWIDTEHTAIDNYTLLLHLIAAHSNRSPCFVRIPWNDPVRAKPVLEMGIDGMIFPMIENAEDAQQAVAACLYPPDGVRGFGPRRAIRYGLDPVNDYIHKESQEIIKLVQIETRSAMEHVEEIAAVPGVDILVLGPCDLSGAYGKLNQIKDSQMQELYKQVAAAAHAVGKTALVASGNYSQEGIAMWAELGFDMITVGSEADYIMNGAREVTQNFANVLQMNMVDR